MRIIKELLGWWMPKHTPGPEFDVTVFNPTTYFRNGSAYQYARNHYGVWHAQCTHEVQRELPKRSIDRQSLRRRGRNIGPRPTKTEGLMIVERVQRDLGRLAKFDYQDEKGVAKTTTMQL